MSAATAVHDHRRDRPMFAIGLRLAAMLMLASTYVCGKLLSDVHVGIGEIVFYRQLFAWPVAAAYAAVQVAGAVAGVWLAHAMFALPLLQVSAKLREGPAQALSELVATFGLVATILGCLRFRPQFTPVAVGLYITAAYWFTASTSFANPAVTLARSLSDTFAGIAPASVPAFIAAQFAGAILALGVFNWLLKERPAA